MLASGLFAEGRGFGREGVGRPGLTLLVEIREMGMSMGKRPSFRRQQQASKELTNSVYGNILALSHERPFIEQSIPAADD